MRIAVLPGDGIGQEIVAQAVRALRRLELPLELEEAPVGGAGYEAAGDPLPAPTLALCREADAILFGAIGGPQYDALPRDKRPERGLLRLRKELGLFANLRPAQVFAELAAKFTPMVDALNEISESSYQHSDQDRLRLYELWVKTGSERSRTLLRKLGLEPAPAARSTLAH